MHNAPWANISISTSSPRGPRMSFSTIWRCICATCSSVSSRASTTVSAHCEKNFTVSGFVTLLWARNMHFDPDAPGIEYRREIGGDDGVDAFGLGAVDYLVDGLHLVLVDDGVDREVGLDPCGVCRGDDLRQVVEREIRSRRRAHVELPDAEIYRVRPGLYGCGQCFVRPYGGHDFYLGALHSVVCGGCPCVVCRRGVGGISFCVPSGSGRIRASVPCGIFRPKGCRGCPALFRSAAKSAVR